jgi:hypothetical protein
VDESGTRDMRVIVSKKGWKPTNGDMTERNAHYCIKNIKKGL